ncbi:hypothetical protein [Burkholderia sp. Ac-20379]|uniref:hypothetical protein n=1 Tax=Burkholderia sp. Ac-20379 TaxID=2703900 RepID=UPI0019806008|nr:hypothetical protein [Burkholderia sp. Ac-20379]MBN3727770.1 UDP-N-acetylglucosamine-peptide N-acetylglucosaminyltransferase [Burkholderia sp. Ac-20379]
MTHPALACLHAARTIVDRAWKDQDAFDDTLREAAALLDAERLRHPHDVAVLTCLGAVLCDLQQHALAREHLELAISLGTTDRNTHVNLFVALLGCTTQAKAKAALKRAAGLDANPATWQAYFDPHAM